MKPANFDNSVIFIDNCGSAYSSFKAGTIIVYLVAEGIVGFLGPF